MSLILIVSDGKPGHLNQSLGLAEALQRQRPKLQIEQCAPLSRGQALLAWLGGATGASTAVTSAAPVLLIGAGHRTHLTLLALKRRFHVPAIVLMKPSLPLSLFDLCLIPEHDSPSADNRVLITQGALNRMRPQTKQPGSGMILIGGPSRNSGWDETILLQNLQRLIGDGAQHWRITSSRRTPPSTERLLAGLKGAEFIPAVETGSGWLPAQLATTESCWVTEDSVSMVYEALSAGCAVGTLDVPGSDNRLRRGLQKLAEQGIMTPFSAWHGGPLRPPAQTFNEAERCAEQILNRGWI